MPYFTYHVDLKGTPHVFFSLLDDNGNPIDAGHWGYGPEKTALVNYGKVFPGYDAANEHGSAGSFSEVIYSKTTYVTQASVDAMLVRIGQWVDANQGTPGSELYVAGSTFLNPLIGGFSGFSNASTKAHNLIR